jgi:hypothetical protein
MHISSQTSPVLLVAAIIVVLGIIYVLGEKWFHQKLNGLSCDWSIVIRGCLCSIASFYIGIHLAIQGKGDWIWSGFVLGLLLGSALSALLFSVFRDWFAISGEPDN